MGEHPEPFPETLPSTARVLLAPDNCSRRVLRQPQQGSRIPLRICVQYSARHRSSSPRPCPPRAAQQRPPVFHVAECRESLALARAGLRGEGRIADSPHRSELDVFFPSQFPPPKALALVLNSG